MMKGSKKLLKESKKILKGSKKNAEGKVTPQGHRTTDLDFSVFFFQCSFFSLVVFSYNILNHSQLAPSRTLSKLPSPL